jgi:hypothetical protein
MERNFSDQLDLYVRQAGLSLRQMASLSGIPYQTIYNWLKGSQPRWHMALPNDLHRLGTALGLTSDEISLLLQLAGCISARTKQMFTWMKLTGVFPQPTSSRKFTLFPHEF